MADAKIRIVVDASQATAAARGSGSAEGDGRSAAQRATGAAHERQRSRVEAAGAPGQHREALGKDEVGALRAFIRGLTGNRSMRPEDGIQKDVAQWFLRQPVLGRAAHVLDRARAEAKRVKAAVDARDKAVKADREAREAPSEEKGKREEHEKKSGGGANRARKEIEVAKRLTGAVKDAEAGVAAAKASGAPAAQIAGASRALMATRASAIGGAAALGATVGLGIAAAAPTVAGVLEGVTGGRITGLSDFADKAAAAFGAVGGAKEGVSKSIDAAIALGVAGAPGVSSEKRAAMLRGLMLAETFQGVMDEDIKRQRDRIWGQGAREAAKAGVQGLRDLFAEGVR